jgi:protein-L-isoaspartate(D-aspartate) O-methyltransferase
MMTSNDNPELKRQQMVKRQIEARGISDERILQAMRDVPRERFIPGPQAHLAYADQPVPIGQRQTISQPYVVALTLEALQLEPEHSVLDVGVGSGYQAALLGKLCKHVYAIERIAELAHWAEKALADAAIQNVTVRCGDGTLGWPEAAPFDRIVCGAAGPDVPAAWVEQLAEGGRIVAPLGDQQIQTLSVIEKHEGAVLRRSLGDVRFVKLIGEQGWPEE